MGARRETEKSPGLAAAPRAALHRVLRAVAMLVGVVVVGTAGYMLIAGWGFLDALYMTVITIGTVGYQEVHDLSDSPLGRIWTIMLVVGGVGTLAYAASSLVELVVEGTVTGYFHERRMQGEIEKLNGHFILCGFGRVGREVAEELRAENVAFVVVDEDEDVIREAREDGYLAWEGVASDDDVLAAAGVSRAKGLVAAVDSDADNVFVVLSARRANPDLHIVARCESDETEAKLEVAGANRTLSPYAFAGRRLARLACHPSVVDYLDLVTGGEHGQQLHLEEFEVAADSPLANRTVGELYAAERRGPRILAIRRPDETFNTTPAEEDRVVPGDMLVVLGTPEQIGQLETLVEA